MARLPRAAVLAAALCALAPMSGGWATAQVVSSVDVGTASLRYDNLVSTSAVTVTPVVRYEGSRSTLSLTGTASFFEEGSWSSQAAAAGSIFSRAYRGILRGEVAGSIGSTLYENYAHTGRGALQLRAHALTDTYGAWAGTGLVRSWDEGTDWTAPSIEGGAWLRRGALTAATSLSASRWREWSARPSMSLDERITVAGAAPSLFLWRNFVDLDASISWVHGIAQVNAFAGARRGGQPGINQWAGLGASIWVSRQFALVAGAGSYPADLGQGVPGGRYATLALRLASRPPRPVQAPSVSRARAAQFLVRGAAGDSLRTLRIRAPGAHRVELMGDFTDWRPVALVPAGGDRWEIALRIPAGAHRVNIRVDGGEWDVPPGVTPITDDFSGTVGVFVID